MFRKDGALKFPVGSTWPSGQQQIFLHGLGIGGSDVCKRRRGRACWVLSHSALPQRCPSVANGFQPKRRARTGERAACKCAHSQSGLAGQKREEAPAADRLREPESVHDEVGLTSQQRGERSVAGI